MSVKRSHLYFFGWFGNYAVWNKGDISILFLHLPSLSLRVSKDLQGTDDSFELAMLCESRLDRARGILDGMHCVYRGHDDV